MDNPASVLDLCCGDSKIARLNWKGWSHSILTEERVALRKEVKKIKRFQETFDFLVQGNGKPLRDIMASIITEDKCLFVQGVDYNPSDLFKFNGGEFVSCERSIESFLRSNVRGNMKGEYDVIHFGYPSFGHFGKLRQNGSQNDVLQILSSFLKPGGKFYFCSDISNFDILEGFIQSIREKISFREIENTIDPRYTVFAHTERKKNYSILLEKQG